MTTFTAHFFKQIYVADPNILLHGFAHIINRKGSHSYSRQSFHLHTCLPLQRTVAKISIRQASPSISYSISTPVSKRGWHRGIRSGVRLAPIMPAICAVAKTSPFYISSVIRANVSLFSQTDPRAVAWRLVISFPPTETIWALPSASK